MQKHCAVAYSGKHALVEWNPKMLVVVCTLLLCSTISIFRRRLRFLPAAPVQTEKNALFYERDG